MPIYNSIHSSLLTKFWGTTFFSLSLNATTLQKLKDFPAKSIVYRFDYSFPVSGLAHNFFTNDFLPKRISHQVNKHTQNLFFEKLVKKSLPTVFKDPKEKEEKVVYQYMVI